MVKTVLVYIIYWILISIKEFIMQPELIFEPVINMLWLSLAVFAFGTVLRLKAIVIDKKNTEDDFKIPTFENGSELIQNSQRNLTNLFEFPIFFYAV